MIKGTFKRDQHEQIISIEITGHAGFGEEGEDIVCAGISSLVYSTLNSIAKLADFEPIVDINEQEGGYLYAELPAGISEEQNDTAQVLLESLLIGFQTIQESYADYLKIQTEINFE